jgi:hypothetical protein
LEQDERNLPLVKQEEVPGAHTIRSTWLKNPITSNTNGTNGKEKDKLTIEWGFDDKYCQYNNFNLKPRTYMWKRNIQILK